MPNVPYLHLMLVSQNKVLKTKNTNNYCMLPPNLTKPSITDFTFLLQVAFPLTFAIFVTAATTSAHDIDKKSLLKLLNYSICSHHCRQGMRHSTTSCTMSYNCGKRYLLSQMYRSTLSQTMRAEMCVLVLKTFLNTGRK